MCTGEVSEVMISEEKKGQGPSFVSHGECECDFRANENQEHQKLSRNVVSKNNEIIKCRPQILESSKD
jgi:hypothetical protein